MCKENFKTKLRPHIFEESKWTARPIFTAWLKFGVTSSKLQKLFFELKHLYDFKLNLNCKYNELIIPMASLVLIIFLNTSKEVTKKTQYIVMISTKLLTKFVKFMAPCIRPHGFGQYDHIVKNITHHKSFLSTPKYIWKKPNNNIKYMVINSMKS